MSYSCCYICKTDSRITYTVLVETLNPAQSNPIHIVGSEKCIHTSGSPTDFHLTMHSTELETMIRQAGFIISVFLSLRSDHK